MQCPCCSDSHSHIPCYATAVLTVTHTVQCPISLTVDRKLSPLRTCCGHLVLFMATRERCTGSRIIKQIAVSNSVCSLSGKLQREKGLYSSRRQLCYKHDHRKIAGQLSGKFVSRDYWRKMCRLVVVSNTESTVV